MSRPRVSPVEFAKQLRQRQTTAEARLWQELRREQLGVKFRRQGPILSYIVDFWCPSHALAVELDGPIHDSRREYDERRDLELVEFGVLVLRFKNQRVYDDLAGVVAEIRAVLSRRPAGWSPKVREAGRRYLQQQLVAGEGKWIRPA